MALVRTNVGSYSSGTAFGTGAYNPAAFTPPANSLLVVAVAAEENGDTGQLHTVLTVDDSQGLTWTPQVSNGAAGLAAWANGIAVFTAPAAAAVSTTLTIDCGTKNIYHYFVQVFAYTAHNGVGATASQTALASNAAISITLSGAPATTSEVIAFTGAPSATSPGAVPGSGWAEIYDQMEDSELQLESQVRSGSTSTTVAWTTSCGSIVGNNNFAMAVEIKAAPYIGYRTFDGDTDEVHTALGNLNGVSNLSETWIIAFRRLGSDSGELVAHSAYTGVDIWIDSAASSSLFDYDSGNSGYIQAPSAVQSVNTTFEIVAMTRPALGNGTQPMRWHIARWDPDDSRWEDGSGNAGVMIHADTTGNVGANQLSYSDTGTIIWGNFVALNCDIALAARCNVILSDAELNALVASGVSSYSTWAALRGLTNLWRFDGVGGADPVNDLVGTSSYVSSTGTTTTADAFPIVAAGASTVSATLAGTSAALVGAVAATVTHPGGGAQTVEATLAGASAALVGTVTATVTHPGGAGYNALANLIEAWDPANAVLSGSNVTSLPGTHNSRTLTTPAGDPTIVTAGLPSGSNSILVNSGSAKYLELLQANMVSGTTFTFMAAMKLVTAVSSANDRVFSWCNSGAGADWNNVSSAVFHPEPSPAWPFGYRNLNPIAYGTTVNAEVWHLFMGIFDGTYCTFYIALSGDSGWSVAAQTNNAATTGTFDIDEFRIGAHPGGANTGQAFEIGDVAWYTDAKDPTARQELFDIAYRRAFGAAAQTVEATLAGASAAPLGAVTATIDHPAGAAIALVDRTAVAGANGGTSSPAINTTGATLLVAFVSELAGGGVSLSDNKGNDWSVGLTAQTGTQPDGRIFYVANPTVGTGHTFTVTGASSFSAVEFAAFSGVKASLPFDQQNGGSGAGYTDATAQPGSITPGEDNELIVCGFGTAADVASLTVNESMTMHHTHYAGGTNFGGALAWKVQGAKAAINPLWGGISGSVAGSIVIASFKAGAAPPAAQTVPGPIKHMEVGVFLDNDVYIRVGGVWERCDVMYRREGGVWVRYM